MSVPLPNREGEQAPIHPVLAARYSPRAWSADDVGDDDLASLLEAARWAPSWGNVQPARYVVVRRGTPEHERLAALLSRGNRAWAPAAPVLLLGCAVTAKDDGTPNDYALHDLGQATAHLTFEAAARGLHVHQMAGFDADAVHAAFGLPADTTVATVVAVGRAGDPATLDDRLREKEERKRTRRSTEPETI